MGETPSDEKAEALRPIPWFRIVGWSLAGALAIYLAAWWFACPVGVAQYGALGDALSPLAVLGSTIGLIAALVSVSLQRTELALQRDEVKKSNAQFERTAEAQEEQVKALREQVNALKEQARVAEAQRRLLEESTRAARLQAAAAAWPPIHTFVTQALAAIAILRVQLDVLHRGVQGTVGTARLDSIVRPLPPDFLDVGRHELARGIADGIMTCRDDLVTLFRDPAHRRGIASVSAAVDEVARQLEEYRSLVTKELR